jgi:hypothetical protein
MTDPRVQEQLAPYQREYPGVDLGKPCFSSHGEYWYNLHVVIVNEARCMEIRNGVLGRLSQMIDGVALKHGYRMSRVAVFFDWNGDGRRDLVTGRADGRVQVWPNVNTDTDPQFGAAGYVQVGEPGSKVDIDVGTRATLDIVDWNNDSRYDLVLGGMDGRVRVYLNEADVGH